MSVSSIEKQIDKLEDDLDLAKSKILIRCEKCKKKRSIKNTVYIQSLWYESPYSCTGGARWRNGEGKFVCSYCGHINRLYGPSGKYYTSPEAKLDIESLKNYFKEIKKFYSNGRGGGHYEGEPDENGCVYD